MKFFILIFLLGFVVTGCTDQAEGNSPTESEKQMLQCKDNLREYESLLRGQRAARTRRSKRGKKKSSPKLPTGVPGCPAAGADTYTESYDAKTGELYCKGHHHKKIGLEENYPRLVPPAQVPKEKKSKEKHRPRHGRHFAPNVKENASGSTPIPNGFPLPLFAPVEVLSSTVGRRDGVFHVFLRYDGDLEEVEKKWRKLLNDQVHNPNQKDSVGVGGSTPPWESNLGSHRSKNQHR